MLVSAHTETRLREMMVLFFHVTFSHLLLLSLFLSFYFVLLSSFPFIFISVCSFFLRVSVQASRSAAARARSRRRCDSDVQGIAPGICSEWFSEMIMMRERSHSTHNPQARSLFLIRISRWVESLPT